jgi:pimeloyl-ACP methyl ester carboxylesterase
VDIGLGIGVVDISGGAQPQGDAPVRVRYREWGAGGAPVVLLHGGWGYDIYPFDRQIAALESSHHIVAPDRVGYGGSGPVGAVPTDFHQRAAEETIRVLDALGLERPVLWGHSDGAVIALRLGLMAPSRIAGIVAEATHLFRDKPASRAFFETMRDAPEALGERVATVLARDHGERWRELIAKNGAAWLAIARQGGDLYDGRLGALRVPLLVIHGLKDPRTEHGELEALRIALERRSEDLRHTGGTEFLLLTEGGHSPHTERATADEVTRTAARWIADATRPVRD